MEDYIRCPHCGGETPGENLNCIYCGNTLPHRLGVFSGLRYGWKGVIFAIVAAAVLFAFIALIF